MNNNHTDKMCPIRSLILAITIKGKEELFTDNTINEIAIFNKCIGKNCSWYLNDTERCAISYK